MIFLVKIPKILELQKICHQDPKKNSGFSSMYLFGIGNLGILKVFSPFRRFELNGSPTLLLASVPRGG